ncbi:MAG: tRNA (5-methylaminomethyl-2-thiouridine)(34)-methyltransferase MnmD [Reichenbachiella sp.]|uniref:tRNA (5-methylaminomethyl-2-thiouridine)(34)-methyltransferase MnmD n=1 Tax=Reichenbachiella sp. TaxID=2184521 RepID=UPI0032630B88
MSNIKVIETRDGSSSLLIPEMNETYHSTHGAITESEYVFLKMGLNHFREMHTDQNEIRILEIGFGTGLNVWLTALAAMDFDLKIKFVSIEKFPLEANLVNQLNYRNKKGTEAEEIFDQIHSSGWGKEQAITDQFSLIKNKSDLFDFDTPAQSFDIVYFDAFAPSKQPEMWSLEILNKMFDLLDEGGVFVTYCAQGQFKRDLKLAGFETEELEGPPGKKEMTRGTKKTFGV